MLIGSTTGGWVCFPAKDSCRRAGASLAARPWWGFSLAVGDRIPVIGLVPLAVSSAVNSLNPKKYGGIPSNL
jgi:hypothetical protein